MEFDKYIKELRKLLNDLGNDENIEAFEKEAFKKIRKYLTDSLTIKNGAVSEDKALISTLEGINRFMNKLFADNSIIAEFFEKNTDALKQIGSLIINFHRSQIKDFSPKSEVSEQLAVYNYIEDIKGVKDIFTKKIRRGIVDGVIRRDSYTTILDDLEQQTAKSKNSEVKKYLKTTARLASNIVSGSASAEFYKRYKDKITHVGVEGTVIETSAPQCKVSIEKYKGEVPIDKFIKEILPLAKDNGLIEDTDITNVWVNLLHWNCRHTFTPLIIK